MKVLDLHERPSSFIGIEDEYTAFCFDEAVAWIVGELRNGREPILSDQTVTEYSKPSDYYKKFS